MFSKTVSASWFITPILIALGSPANASELLRFRVYLGDKPIGEHSFHITETGDLTLVSSRAAFDVDFLFVNAYRRPENQRPLGHAVHLADKGRLQGHLSGR